MKSIFLTGPTGFVGTYLYSHFRNQYLFIRDERYFKIIISQDSSTLCG